MGIELRPVIHTELVTEHLTVRSMQTCGRTVLLERQSFCEQEHVTISCLSRNVITFASCERQFCSVRSGGVVLHCISDWSCIYWRASLSSTQVLSFKVEQEIRS